MQLEPALHGTARPIFVFVADAIALAAITSANALATNCKVASGAFGSRLAVVQALNHATPVILAGRAIAITFRTTLLNIGFSERPHDAP
jgi:general nucleoside transport system permease protein